MSLVNDSLKFTSSDMQICWFFFCWKNVSSFCRAKATHIFSGNIVRILYIESAKTVNEMTLNELVKLTRLWTTEPRTFNKRYHNKSTALERSVINYPKVVVAWEEGREEGDGAERGKLKLALRYQNPRPQRIHNGKNIYLLSRRVGLQLIRESIQYKLFYEKQVILMK